MRKVTKSFTFFAGQRYYNANLDAVNADSEAFDVTMPTYCSDSPAAAQF
jgi:hypothetical protein